MAFLTLLIGKFAIRLTANHFAERHFTEVDSMLRGAAWQEDYPPSVGCPAPLSAIEIALKRVERLERDPFLVSIRESHIPRGLKQRMRKSSDRNVCAS
jgi:hypothetical protein